MKFRKAILLLISMCALCMFGLLMTNEIRKRSTGWNLIVDGVSVSQETMDFRGFMVIPGGSDEYTVRVTPVSSVYADLLIDFNEIENSINAPLKDYARVSISIKGEQVVDKLLSELFEGERYKKVLKIVEGQPFDIDIRFYLPEDVGNVVRNTTADFYVDIVLENQIIGDFHA